MNQEELSKHFINPEKYNKFGSVLARLAKEGEIINTVIDGVVETKNKAKKTDVIITGPENEEYIIDFNKFNARYIGPNLSYKNRVYSAVGHCYAVKWTGESTSFVASWGEKMIINDGDWLCSPTKIPDGDLYRIEKNVFNKTYEKDESSKNKKNIE